MLSDLGVFPEKREANLRKKATTKDKYAIAELELVNLALGNYRPDAARCADIPGRERDFKNLQLINAAGEPMCAMSKKARRTATAFGKSAEKPPPRVPVVIISARIEEELAQLDDGERLEYPTLGLTEPGLNRLIRRAMTFWNSSPISPARKRPALDHKAGTPATRAGDRHTDFERGFIRAETISYEDFTKLNGEQGTRRGSLASRRQRLCGAAVTSCCSAQRLRPV